MSALTPNTVFRFVIARKDFDALFGALKSSGYRTIGPTLKDNAVVYDAISSADDLPVGWVDRQDNGTYRLTKDKKQTLFGYVVGPYSWKRFLHVPDRLLSETKRGEGRYETTEQGEKPVKQAFIGVRPCELQAIAIQDKVLLEGQYADSSYSLRRKHLFIVAVNCTRAGGVCFCLSMKTGPKATAGFDLALTEVINSKNHYFIVETGSKAGTDILREVPHRKASNSEIEAAEKAIQEAASHMGRKLQTEGLKELLYRNFDNPHWEKVAARCLTCGNCTMVCPTCFCTNIEDTTDLSGERAQRRSLWDTCFTVDFSYIHGGSIRATAMSRYRQWMMHKLAYWMDQFGTFGCVGCGRCITWCPVGIDITEEARVIRESE